MTGADRNARAACWPSSAQWGTGFSVSLSPVRGGAARRWAARRRRRPQPRRESRSVATRAPRSHRDPGHKDDDHQSRELTASASVPATAGDRVTSAHQFPLEQASVPEHHQPNGFLVRELTSQPVAETAALPQMPTKTPMTPTPRPAHPERRGRAWSHRVDAQPVSSPEAGGERAPLRTPRSAAHPPDSQGRVTWPA